KSLQGEQYLFARDVRKVPRRTTMYMYGFDDLKRLEGEQHLFVRDVRKVPRRATMYVYGFDDL
ncbi:unnamed protein product, partial [Dovyalis caffra]